MRREEAMQLIRKHLTKNTSIYHSLAVEAIMRALARYLSEDEQIWGLTGLLHDIDYELTFHNINKHGILAEALIGNIVPQEVVRAIKSHNFENTNVNPETKMEKALIAADAISGLLIACALVMPSKRIEEVNVNTIERKFKSRDFARKVSREHILLCEQIGIPREKFFEIALNALKNIARDIGL